MRQDASIGHAQRLAVGQQQHLVRPDAAAIEFADAPVGAAGRGVVDAEHTASAIEVIFGGGQQPAVVEERAMAEEMPVLRQVQFNGAGRAIQAEAQREEARLAAEDHGAPAGRVNGEAVATRRHRHDAQVAARFVQQRGLVAAAALARAQVAGPAGPRGLGGPFCFGGQGRDRYMAQPQRGPSARKRRRSIAIERVEADGHAQRGRQVLVDHRLGVLQGQPGQRPLAARLAVAGHVLVGRRRVAQGLRGARQSPRTASSIQLPPCGSG